MKTNSKLNHEKYNERHGRRMLQRRALQFVDRGPDRMAGFRFYVSPLDNGVMIDWCCAFCTDRGLTRMSVFLSSQVHCSCGALIEISISGFAFGRPFTADLPEVDLV